MVCHVINDTSYQSIYLKYNYMQTNWLNKIKELKMEVFETSFSECKFLVTYEEKHFEVNKKVFELLTILQKADSIETAAKEYTSFRGLNCTATDISNLLESKFSIFFDKESVSKKEQFIFSIRLFSPKIVNILSSTLKHLYSNYFYLFVFLINVSLSIYFLINYYNQISFSLIHLDVYKFLLVFIILFLSTFFHELGHASASKYCGISPGEIGFGIYLNIPVFYTDVTGVWQLDRKQRLLVNIGGVYFQCLLLIPCYFLYFHTKNIFFGYLILATNLNFILVLNPFLKFDGYWIVSDLLGIPNLRKRTRDFFTYFFQRLLGKQNLKRPDLLNLKPSIKILAIIYSIITVGFMTLFFIVFIPWFIYKIIKDIPSRIELLGQEILLRDSFPFDILFSFLSKILLLIFFVYFVSKMIYKLVKAILSNINHFKNKRSK